jgi:hypothetical protein
VNTDDLTVESVHEAIDESDRMGRHAALRRYGCRQSLHWLLDHDSQFYDPAAIVAAAHKFVDPELRPLPPTSPFASEANAAQILRYLGFSVVKSQERQIPGAFQIEPYPLSGPETEYLAAFHQTRRQTYDSLWLDTHPEPDEVALREAVGVPLGNRGDFYVGQAGRSSPNDGRGILDEERLSHASVTALTAICSGKCGEPRSVIRPTWTWPTATSVCPSPLMKRRQR